ncbi:hypothetical protein N7527_005184 [Penicillium freii]|nr:hypothetical protein N7527_005184 [Penicillium freii]
MTNKTETIPSPGGFITYVIWAKVAGDSLNWEAFWSSSFSQRQEIRLQFDEVYEHLSGLSDWTPAAEGTKWPDSIYVNYGLVQPPTAKDHFFSIHSEDLQYDDKGWRW